MANTTNYSWLLPTVGGDTGAWGTVANNIFIAVDAAVKAVNDLVAAALSKAGGVMTGKLDLSTSSTKRVDLGLISGTHTFDLAVAQSYTFTVGGPLAIAFSNAPAGVVTSGVMFRMTNAGAYAVTWPTSAPAVRWPGGTAPVWTAAGTDRVALISDDAGVTADGIVLGKAFA